MRQKRPNKNKLYQWTMTVITVFLVGLSTSSTVSAEEEPLGYTVDIIEPETQIDKTKDFFNIQTRPGEVQTIQAIVKSLRKEPVTIKVFAENAMTNEAGQINYSDDKSILDKSLVTPISDMVKILTPEVTVANQEEKIVEIQVSPPEESYEGIKLADLAFQLQDENEQGKSGVGSMFAYRIGLLTMEEDIDYADSKTVKLVKVTPNIHRGKKTLLVRFQNPEPKILSNFTLAYSLTKKGSQKPIKEESTQNHNMAPNSNFNFPIDLGMDNASAGEYTLKVTIENTYGSWDFNEAVQITGSQAKKMNDESAFKLLTPVWIKGIAIGMAVLSVISSIVIFYRQSKWKTKLKEQRKKKKKKRGRK
ncbi:DUF916 and DUF3324 domain-containing protein [uncultured Vagococcus sp.]|uniref:DUF916 and DUF3324 domain-containing protein n=1 Tax=uncultured Vagococcus sp. TaxID=189676 RepID=UPI0028D266CA|nr:DUF916 and DUF3324 domain-containing protein [uncultured Vagococcus sp.]